MWDPRTITLLMTHSVYSASSYKSSSVAVAAAAASSIFMINSPATKIQRHTRLEAKNMTTSKQIRLVQVLSLKNNQKSISLASICVKRNIIFGPKLIHLSDKGFVKTLSPHLNQAFDQASVEGYQP